MGFGLSLAATLEQPQQSNNWLVRHRFFASTNLVEDPVGDLEHGLVVAVLKVLEDLLEGLVHVDVGDVVEVERLAELPRGVGEGAGAQEDGRQH